MTTFAHLESQQVTMDILANKVAKNLGDLNYIPLASAIGFDQEYVAMLNSSVTNQQTAYKILIDWKAAKAADATYGVLCAALKKIGRCDLAEEVMAECQKKELAPTPNVLKSEETQFVAAQQSPSQVSSKVGVATGHFSELLVPSAEQYGGQVERNPFQPLHTPGLHLSVSDSQGDAEGEATEELTTVEATTSTETDEHEMKAATITHSTMTDRSPQDRHDIRVNVRGDQLSASENDDKVTKSPLSTAVLAIAHQQEKGVAPSQPSPSAAADISDDRNDPEWHRVFQLVARQINSLDLFRRFASMLDFSDGIEQEAHNLASKPNTTPKEATFKLLEIWFQKRGGSSLDEVKEDLWLASDTIELETQDTNVEASVAADICAGRKHAEWRRVFRLVAREINSLDLFHRFALMLDYCYGIEEEAHNVASKLNTTPKEATFKLLKIWFEKRRDRSSEVVKLDLRFALEAIALDTLFKNVESIIF